MTHKIAFKNISGNCIIGNFNSNDTVSNACMFLSKQIAEPIQNIRLLSPDGCTFLADHIHLIDSLLKNITSKNTIIYFLFPDRGTQTMTCRTPQPLKGDNSNITVFPHIRTPINSLSLFQEIAQKPSDRAVSLYNRYAKAFELPSDFEQKVEELREMGFSDEDSRAALRSTNFNVEAAANQIINNQNGRNEDDGAISILENLGTFRNGVLEVDLDAIRNFLDVNQETPQVGLLNLLIHLFRNQRNNDDGENYNADYDHHNDYEEDVEENDNDLSEELDQQLITLEDLCHDFEYTYFPAFNEYISQYRYICGAKDDESLIKILDFMNARIGDHEEMPGFISRSMQHMQDNVQLQDVDDIKNTIEELITEYNVTIEDKDVFEVDETVI